MVCVRVFGLRVYACMIAFRVVVYAFAFVFVASVRFMFELCVDCMRGLLSCFLFVHVCLYACLGNDRVRLPMYVARLRFILHVRVYCMCALLSCLRIDCLQGCISYYTCV